ncbi:MAG: SNF2-related protein [Armatimonadetes bacterium]|nr:SNF2-related protein [Armatimonadota bacterium]
MSTDFHAAYYAHELTKRTSSDNLAKLGPSLFGASVDLNPHQLDAALFAFRSPLSRGAILADEVGLGKTIEAGLIISQLWCEHKRRILIVAPTILRKQWAQELADKFHIDSVIVDSREYNARTKKGESAFEPVNKVVICSYHFAWAKEAEILHQPWDLVAVDEAHRLRNVYKPGNRIAASIKRSISSRPLLLLTATPLQNTLLELYGLVSFIDEHLFGDLDAFRSRYMRGAIQDRQLGELSVRLRPICQRTLRRQVTEYIRFTNRIPITQDFTPTPEEKRLYDRVSNYLSREKLHALPTSQRRLMTLVLRKLLASSSFAIAATLDSLRERLEGKHRDILAATASDFEALEELTEEWAEQGIPAEGNGPEQKPSEREQIAAEIKELAESGELAKSITANAKGQALLSALQQGFDKLEELGANRKAVIFTESRRTQTYLYELLARNGFEGRLLTINGVNSDERSREIYKAWVELHRGEPVVTGNKVVDIRAALVEHFESEADILIATEAAAEGVNLQFCSLVVNFDLPWNPQRIEQRIGRCHRYGQKHDVVVVNFLNRKNAADMRVFELLAEKFLLFQGVFGSSDEVLGALESGVDFERRIADIYQSCRTEAEINAGFDQLRLDLEEEIQARMADTRTKLLENFDDDVRQKLKINKDQSVEFLDRMGKCFWELTKHELSEHADFDDSALRFHLRRLPEDWPDAPSGDYQFMSPGRQVDGFRPYRYGNDLAEHAVAQARGRELPPAHIVFDYSNLGEKVGLVEQLVGQSGWLRVCKLTIKALEEEDKLIFAGVGDDGTQLLPEACEKLFSVRGEVLGGVEVPDSIEPVLSEASEQLQQAALNEIAARNGKFFDEEIDKLERWADDLKHSLEMELKDLDLEIRQVSKDAKLARTLDEKVALHRRKKDLETERNRKRRALYEAQDEIDAKKEQLISDVEAKLSQQVSTEPVFTIRWAVR